MNKRTEANLKANLQGTALAFPPQSKTDGSIPATVELQLNWVRMATSSAELERCCEDARQGRVYTFKMIARMFGCSNNTAWRLFRKEPGVFRLNSAYRIPETVLRRVLNRIMQSDNVRLETLL